MGRFICLVPRHHVISAAGFDPELLHSMSYDFSAETDGRLAKMWTAAGFTVFHLKRNWMKFVLISILRWRPPTLDSTTHTDIFHLQFTSKISTLLFGGTKFVLLAMQTNRAFTCWRPMFGNVKWLRVTPSRCSKLSSITVLSRYQVTFGRGRPEKNKYNLV